MKKYSLRLETCGFFQFAKLWSCEITRTAIDWDPLKGFSDPGEELWVLQKEENYSQPEYNTWYTERSYLAVILDVRCDAGNNCEVSSLWHMGYLVSCLDSQIPHC